MVKTLSRSIAFTAALLVFGSPGTSPLPTVGGEAHAAVDIQRSLVQSFVMAELDRRMADCPYTDPWLCVFVPQDSDGDGIPDSQDACPSQPGTGDGCPGGGPGCAAGYVLTTYGFYSGFISIMAPEPVVSKPTGFLLSGRGWRAWGCLRRSVPNRTEVEL